MNIPVPMDPIGKYLKYREFWRFQAAEHKSLNMYGHNLDLCRSRNRLLDFTLKFSFLWGGIWLIFGICLPVFAQSSTFFEALHGGFCWVSFDSKICFNLSPVWRSERSFLQWLCWCQPCKLSTVNICYILSPYPKSIQILCPFDI